MRTCEILEQNEISCSCNIPFSTCELGGGISETEWQSGRKGKTRVSHHIYAKSSVIQDQNNKKIINIVVLCSNTNKIK